MSARLTIVALACLISASALALADEPRLVNVPAGNLIEGLESLAKQCGVDVIYPSGELKGLKTRGVSGTLEPKEAFRKLIEGTPLILKEQGNALLITLPGASTRSQSSNPSETAGSDEQSQEGKTKSSSNFLLAQVDQGQTSSDASVANTDEKSKQRDELHEVHPNMPEILIKGSRVMNVDVKRTEDDAQPYYIFDSQQIEQSGATNVEDFLKQELTMNTTALTSSQQYGSGAGGTSSINLRGLGANETLILIDGRRSAAVTVLTATGQPDINGIPLAAIERIEVLPSSASAIYGGAAVGGVVNIVLKKDFQGGEINGIYDSTFNAGAPIRTLNATYGFSLEDGKTRIMLSGQYSDAQPLVVNDRSDLVGRGISTILSNSPSFLYNLANPFQGATTNIASANGSNLILKGGTPLNSPITYVPAGAAPGSNLAGGLLANAGTYNLNLSPGTGEYGLQNAMGASPQDETFMATVRREFAPGFEAFSEFSTVSNSSRQLYNFFSGDTFSIPSTAPDNPFQQAVNLTFPSTLSAPLTTDSVTQSATVGFLARLPGSWKSEFDYTWSRNSLEYAIPGLDFIAVPAALAAGTLNPFADTIAYPLNLGRYQTTETYSGNSTLDDIGLRASGPLGSLPWGEPTLTIGLEHRKEGSHNGELYVPYPSSPTDNQNFLVFGQSQSTNSLYAEAQIPLVTSQNALPLVRALEVQLAGRSESYAVHTDTPYAYLSPVFLEAYNPPAEKLTINYTSTNPTVGLKYEPLEELTLRTSYSKAFLPPTASQFLPNPSLVCGPTPCQLITDPQTGQTYLVNYTQGGNPNLRPQTSRDWDLGVIWEPQEQGLRGLRVDLEYYDITQPNYITTPTVQEIVSNPQYASLVTRDPTTGRITVVNDSYVNAEMYKTNGWDLSLDYRKSTAYGTFGLHAVGTVIEHDLRQYTVGGPLADYVGFPSEGGEAKTKANGSLTWTYRHWMLGWTTTFFGSYEQAGAPGSAPVLFYSNTYYTDAQGGYTIPSQVYHDVFATYTLKEVSTGSSVANHLLSDMTVQFGIKNLFNKVPPFDAYYGPYFYSPYGSARLRDYWLSVKKTF
jgi:iron complex outermembrane receptor protein